MTTPTDPRTTCSDRDSRVNNLLVALLDSADDTGCSGDCIVVSKSALRSIAQQVLEDVPNWLDEGLAESHSTDIETETRECRPNARLINALDDIVGPGAQCEDTCDLAEHSGNSLCIWCEAREALMEVRRVRTGSARP